MKESEPGSPGGRRLVQARLPFKLLAAPSPAPAPARKRKPSAPPEEPRPAKLSKENAAQAEPVLISDDDSRASSPRPSPSPSPPPRAARNPLLRLVDCAIKKKLSKKSKDDSLSKTRKRRSKRGRKEIGDVTSEEIAGNESENVVLESEVILTDETEPFDGCDDVVIIEDKEKSDGASVLKDVNVNHSNYKEAPKSINKTEEVPMEVDAPLDSNDTGDSQAENDINLKENDPMSGKYTNKESQNPEIDLKRVTDNENSENDKSNSKNLDNKNDGNNSRDKADSEDLKVKEDSLNVIVLDENDSSDVSESEKSPVSSPTSDRRNSVSSTDNKSVDEKSPGNPESQNVTPKRTSMRTKNAEKVENTTPNKNKTENSDKDHDITTPKQLKKKSMGASTESNEGTSPANKSLTPKQLQRKMDSVKKREEKEKERQERERKRLQEKEERNKVRLEKEEQKRKEREEREEQKRKEREEKEEQRRKEKEEKERQRDLEKKEREEKEEQKRKEREEKEEQKRKEKEAKEEERKKKLEAVEEEKRQKELEKEEQEIKKQKTSEAFKKFFVPKQKIEQTEPTRSNNMLSCFTVKSDMRLAPTVRNYIDTDQKKDLENELVSQGLPKTRLYLQRLKDAEVKPGRCFKTWPLEDKEDDCVIVESEDELPPAVNSTGEVIMTMSTNPERLRAKLLSFHDNRRPPYWGTWRKKSTAIRPRRPFGTDQKQLDYEVDSDEEWEDEGEGESIEGSVAGGGSDNEEVDEYEVDNELFVPHGYLSDEEATMDEDDVMSLSPETQKLKLKHLEDEFESEMKKPTEKLKPRLYGMLWENSEGGQPSNCVDSLWKYFGKMAMILNDPTALLTPAPEPEESEKKKIKKKKSVPANGQDQPAPKTPKSAEKRRKSKPVKRETEVKKSATEPLKNQPGINAFLTKIKS